MDPAAPVSPSLLKTISFSVLPGQGDDGTKYTIKDADGNPILFVLDLNFGQPETSLVIRDAAHADVLRLSNTGALGVRMQLQDASGQSIGSVLIGTKEVKEHKKEKEGKDKKRQIVLNDTLDHTLLSISSKGNKNDGEMKMIIKAKSKKDKDSKDKDKGAKDKDKKDKDATDDKGAKDSKDKGDKGCKDNKDKGDKEAKDKDKDGGENKDKEKKDKDGKDKDKKSKDSGDKKDKDGADEKDKKVKEPKDKDKKQKEKKGNVAEVTGGISTGLHIKFNNACLTLPERVNVIGLVISYMELEKMGTPTKTQ